MYVVVRKDLGMSAGKLAAQAMHGLQYVLEHFNPTADAVRYDNWLRGETEISDELRWCQEWRRGDHTKIVLAVDSLDQLEHLAERVGDRGRIVVDRGRTEVEPNTKTALALFPMPRSLASVWVGALRPYR